MFHLHSVTNLFMLYMLVGIGPPMDRNLIRTDMLRVSAVIYSGISVIASIGIIIAVVFLGINVLFRHHRYISLFNNNRFK
jgi:hypothetical protein